MNPHTLILGATGGVGSELARRLANAGHTLHIVARDAARLRALAEELHASFTVCDVLQQPDDLPQKLAEAGPVLTGMVYAIGSITLKPFTRLTAEDFDRDYRLNAAAAALCVQAALPALRAAPGIDRGDASTGADWHTRRCRGRRRILAVDRRRLDHGLRTRRGWWTCRGGREITPAMPVPLPQGVVEPYGWA